MALNYTWIVDDDAIFTFTVKRMLQRHKLTHRIDLFQNGLEAKIQLEKCRDNNEPYPNVIFLDINMPILDGWQFMDEFSQFEDKENILVYLISSSIDPKDKEKAKQYSDIEDYVIKPVTLDALKNIITNVESSLDIS